MQLNDETNIGLRASAKPFVFRASATSFSPSSVQSTFSSGNTTQKFASSQPTTPPLPTTTPESAACITTTPDTSESGSTKTPRKINLSFKKAAALFAAGAAKTKMLYGNPVLTLAQKIQLKQLQVTHQLTDHATKRGLATLPTGVLVAVFACRIDFTICRQ